MMDKAMSTLKLGSFQNILIGIDWLYVNKLDGLKTEINRLALANNAKWYLTLEDEFGEECYGGFIPKEACSKQPYAGAKIIIDSFKDFENFACLFKLDEDRYWLLGIQNGFPWSKALDSSFDFVGERHDVIFQLNDWMSSIDGEDVTIFTNCPEIESAISKTADWRELEINELAAIVNKKNIKSAAFKAYSKYPLVPMVLMLCVFIGIAGGGWYIYDTSEREKQQQARKRKANLIAKKKETAAYIQKTLNDTLPMHQATKKLMSYIGGVPSLINGWRLDSISCGIDKCILNYKSGPFATWDSYLNGKPRSWSTPEFDKNIDSIPQSIDINLKGDGTQTHESLSTMNDVLRRVGNIAQISRQAGVRVNYSSDGRKMHAGPSDFNVPLVNTIDISGDAHLIDGFVKTLPKEIYYQSVDFKFGGKLGFSLKGKIYANP